MRPSKPARTTRSRASYCERRRAPLGADLHDRTRALRRGRQRERFGDVHTHRLFEIDVRAALHGGNGRQSVPVIRCCDDDDVEPLRCEHLAIVTVERWRTGEPGLRTRRGQPPRLLQHLRIHVGQRDMLYRRDLHQSVQVELAEPASADDANPQAGRLRSGRCA